MTRYKITYSLKDETGYIDASIVERDECSAKKALKAMLKEEGKKLDAIAEITVQAENLPATKQQEREALAAIKAIVDSLGPQSYLATAFDGCFEDAENNIDDDAAYSMKDRWQTAASKLAEAEKEIKALTEKVEEMKQQLKNADDDLDAMRATMEARTLEADDLEDLKRLALEEAAIAETHAEEAANVIVEKADDPTSPDFQQAVKDHRSYTSRADYYNALAERVMAVQNAGA